MIETGIVKVAFWIFTLNYIATELWSLACGLWSRSHHRDFPGEEHTVGCSWSQKSTQLCCVKSRTLSHSVWAVTDENIVTQPVSDRLSADWSIFPFPVTASWPSQEQSRNSMFSTCRSSVLWKTYLDNCWYQIRSEQLVLMTGQDPLEGHFKVIAIHQTTLFALSIEKERKREREKRERERGREPASLYQTVLTGESLWSGLGSRWWNGPWRPLSFSEGTGCVGSKPDNRTWCFWYLDLCPLTKHEV